MNSLDLLRDELRKPADASGSASEIWIRARLDALLEDDRRAVRILGIVQLLAADGAAAALVWPLGNLAIVLIAAMITHAIGTAWAATRSV